MAQAVLTIWADMRRCTAFIDAVAPQLAALPEDPRAAFIAHWRGLESAGAETLVFLTKGATIHAAISDDFRRALAEFGVRGPN